MKRICFTPDVGLQSNSCSRTQFLFLAFFPVRHLMQTHRSSELAFQDWWHLRHMASNPSRFNHCRLNVVPASQLAQLRTNRGSKVTSSGRRLQTEAVLAVMTAGYNTG